MKNIQLCPDGKYRWAYELSLYKNPHILFLVWKIFGWILFGIWVFMLILQVSDGILSAKEIVIFSLKFLGGIGALVFVLSILGYGLYAFIMGGKYCALFEMDGKGVEHKQMKAQVKKAQLIGVLTALAGLAGGRVGTVGQGMMVAGSSGGMYTAFEHVKSIKADKKRSLIKVNETLFKNQVYADGEDFDLALDYIVKRCPNAKVTIK
jgi:hypothetical protein